MMTPSAGGIFSANRRRNKMASSRSIAPQPAILKHGVDPLLIFNPIAKVVALNERKNIIHCFTTFIADLRLHIRALNPTRLCFKDVSMTISYRKVGASNADRQSKAVMLKATISKEDMQ
jgi:hypothetical protein